MVSGLTSLSSVPPILLSSRDSNIYLDFRIGKNQIRDLKWEGLEKDLERCANLGSYGYSSAFGTHTGSREPLSP